MERQGVLLLVERMHASLVSLTLPSGSAPLHRLDAWDWPRLTSLSLYGERSVRENSPSLVAPLRKMPRLRELSLLLAEPTGRDLMPVWPPSLEPSYTLPELERLQVTHPHPEDRLYAHLPASLQRLSLRCWPRYYKHHCDLNEEFIEAGVRWTSPLLSSSEMLRLLRQSETPNLTHLELEFRADPAAYGDIFAHIGSSYSHLTVVQIHCYRSEDGADLSVDQIAYALRGLLNLRLLMLHLDFRCLPDVTVLEMSDTGRREGTQLLQTAAEAIASAADVFAKRLAPSLKYICLLLPLQGSFRQWRVYRVVRSSDGCMVEEYDPPDWSGTLYGYDTNDDE